jgi:hypothetical protein
MLLSHLVKIYDDEVRGDTAESALWGCPSMGGSETNRWFMSGWWFYPSWKMMEFVNGKDDIPYIKKWLKPPARWMFMMENAKS